MTKNSLYLAIDQGGGSTRAIVFDVAGNVVVQSQQAVDVEHPRLGWVEQNAELLASSVSYALDSVAQQLGDRTRNIVTAGLATQRSNIVCWHQGSGKAISPAISWQDRRAYQWMEQFRSSNQLIREKTGLLVSAHYGVSKIKWCLENLVEVGDAVQSGDLAYGPLASYLLYRLLERPRNLVDPANASRTLLWNINTKNWDNDLLALFGIPLEYLPACVDTQSHYGDIVVGDHKVPVTIMTGDQSAALYAYGQPDTDTVYINMGTGVFIQRPTANQKIDIPGLLCSVVYQDQKHSDFVVECTVNGASNALMEVEDALGIPGKEAEKHFAQWAQQYKNPPLFLNGVAGLAAPYWVPDFQSRFIGEGLPEEKVLAVAESILFLISVNLQLLQENYKPLKKIVVTGGLAKNNTLCQKLANLIRMPVYRPVDGEATAKGTACLLTGMTEHWNTDHDGQYFNVQQEPELQQRYQQWGREMQAALQCYSTK